MPIATPAAGKGNDKPRPHLHLGLGQCSRRADQGWAAYNGACNWLDCRKLGPLVVVAKQSGSPLLPCRVLASLGRGASSVEGMRCEHLLLCLLMQICVTNCCSIVLVAAPLLLRCLITSALRLDDDVETTTIASLPRLYLRLRRCWYRWQPKPLLC